MITPRLVKITPLGPDGEPAGESRVVEATIRRDWVDVMVPEFRIEKPIEWIGRYSVTLELGEIDPDMLALFYGEDWPLTDGGTT